MPSIRNNTKEKEKESPVKAEIDIEVFACCPPHAGARWRRWWLRPAQSCQKMRWVQMFSTHPSSPAPHGFLVEGGVGEQLSLLAAEEESL